MNTFFEIVLAEPDENQIAAAEAALDEIQRIESFLSRFDPASEVSRVNREASQRPVLISYELLNVLNLCHEFWMKTFGHFDITATSARGQSFDFKAVILDGEKRTVHFTEAAVKLDFGAFGKGYALDRAAEGLQENGVSDALLHGGTSSVLAIRPPFSQENWKIGVRNPRVENEEIVQVELRNEGFSSSVAFGKNQSVSDILNPLLHAELSTEAGCSVIANTAAEAEVFSTAFLSMGRHLTEEWLSQNVKSSLRVLWIDTEETKSKHDRLA